MVNRLVNGEIPDPELMRLRDRRVPDAESAPSQTMREIAERKKRVASRAPATRAAYGK